MTGPRSLRLLPTAGHHDGRRPEGNGPRHRFARRWVTAAALLVLVGCATSAYAATVVSRQGQDAARRAFAASSAQVAATLKLALQGESDLVISTAAYLASNPQASSADLRWWAESLQVFSRCEEVESLGNVVAVKAADLAGYADQVRRQGGRLTFNPKDGSSLYCFASGSVARPGSPAAAPIGVNLCPGPLVQAVLALRDSGAGAYTPSGGDYVGIGTPSYRGGRIPATLLGRRRDFLGFSGTLIRPQAVLAIALAGHPGMRVTIAYRSGTTYAAFSHPAPARAQMVLDLGGG